MIVLQGEDSKAMRDRKGTEADHRYLTACLDLARLGEGATSPNPMVGAILVKEGRILGQGYHRRAGDRHAEVEALETAGREAEGATLYVNLEPCVHRGRTPPCVEAIVAAGVREVVACMIDPDPRVNGKGFQRLESAGILVRRGLLGEEALRLNEKFVKHATTGIPFVTAKIAMTLDGRTADASGESRWITSPEARQEGHRLRFEHDAILVGVNTVRADNPQLTARHGPGKPLWRVILDSRLRTPPGSQLLANADGGRTVIYTLPGARSVDRDALVRRAGVEVVEVAGETGALDWRAVLEDLGRRQVLSVLMEGGGRVIGSALAFGVVDRVAVFIAPKILGDRGQPAIAGWGVERLSEAIELKEWSWRSVGEDVLVEGRLGPSPRRGSGCSPD